MVDYAICLSLLVLNQMITTSVSREFLQPFFNYLTEFNSLSLEFISQLERECQLLQIRKNKYILSPIDTNNAMYFLLNGSVRGFIKEHGKDISTRFAFENELIEAIKHPMDQSHYSVEYLQAIEDCQLIRIPYQLSDFLYSSYPEANLIGRKILQKQYHDAAERSMLARIPTAIGRYAKIERTKLDSFRVPQRYLASYLGMRLETLSRIKNKCTDIKMSNTA